MFVMTHPIETLKKWAVDKQGDTLDFMLSEHQDEDVTT
jgi:hypothetical protein